MVTTAPFLPREAGRFAPAMRECGTFETLYCEASSERARLVRIGDYSAADGLATVVAESARRTGRLAESSAVLEHAISSSDPRSESARWARWSAANVLRQTGDRVRSASLLREALEAARASGDIWLQLYVRAGKAEAARIDGRYAEAERAHAELLDDFLRLDDTRGMVWAWEGLAQIFLSTGRTERARTLFGRALQACTAGDDLRSLAFAHRGLAETAIACGNGVAGLSHAHAAVHLFGTAGYVIGEGYARKSLAEILLGTSDPDGARLELALARSLFERVNHPRGLLYSDLLDLRFAAKISRADEREHKLRAVAPRVKASGLLLARAELWKATQTYRAGA